MMILLCLVAPVTRFVKPSNLCHRTAHLQRWCDTDSGMSYLLLIMIKWCFN
ncbi:MAG: hypothetical protein HRU23_03125 [Gammaproteobacteria bacterium]|nr:hypothetical protein [Gammaproteobacteria bacterium]